MNCKERKYEKIGVIKGRLFFLFLNFLLVIVEYDKLYLIYIVVMVYNYICLFIFLKFLLYKKYLVLLEKILFYNKD